MLTVSFSFTNRDIKTKFGISKSNFANTKWDESGSGWEELPNKEYNRGNRYIKYRNASIGNVFFSGLL